MVHAGAARPDRARSSARPPTPRPIVIKPGWEWPGHEPGQYLRDRRGRRRRPPLARLLADLGPRSPGRLHLASRRSSSRRARSRPFLVRKARPGAIVRLGGVEGTFVLPDPLPEKLLFISAGSGITPIMSMLRGLDRREALDDVVLPALGAHAGGRHLRRASCARMADAHAGFRLHEQHTGEHGPHGARRPRPTSAPTGASARRSPAAPASCSTRCTSTWSASGDCDRLHMERFQPIIGRATPSSGDGGTIRFLDSDIEAESDGAHADPRRRRGGRRDPALRLPHGHLPHLRRAAVLRPGPRPAHRQGLRLARARWSAPASTPPKAPSRSPSDPPTRGTPWPQP